MAATIADALTLLANNKAAIKQAIIDKGVAVSDNDALSTYADKIESIETGGGGGGDSGSGDSGSDDWVYVNCNTLTDLTNPGAKAGFRFYAQFTNSSNLIVEFIPPYGTTGNPTPTWTSNKLISNEPQPSTDYLIRYRIKPGVNMAVGDVGTLTITNSSGTVTYTFKLVKTFSDTAILNMQSVDDGADIEKLNVSGGPAPYIVNPLNGGVLGAADRRGGAYGHQYQVSSGNIIDAFFVDPTFGYATTVEPNGVYLKELVFGSTYSGWGPYGSILQITASGLLTLSLSSAGSGNWLLDNYIKIVVLTLDSGIQLLDSFKIYNYWTCFIKDTNITLANKTKKKIQDITYNDELLVWNFDEGKYDSAKPLWIKKVQTTTWYYRLTFSDGTVLKVTGDYPKAHSLYSVDDGKFIHANELVGKEVWTLGGIKVLEDCEEIHEEVEFYNIITDYHMNLFANGVLTSTSLNNLYPIKNMRFIKEDREPVFDTSVFEDKWVKGLRLNEQPNDVTDYVNNVIKLNNNTI